MSHRKHHRAFTLVELLVVIGVIAVLISILLPVLNRARSSAKEIACASNVRQLTLGALMYSDANQGYMVPNVFTNHGEIRIDFSANRLYSLTIVVSEKYATPKVCYSPSEVGGMQYGNYTAYWDAVEKHQTWSLGPSNVVLPVSYVMREIYHYPINPPSSMSSTAKYNQAKWTDSPDSNYPFFFRPQKLSRKRITLVADRFCSSGIWSFHEGKSFGATSTAAKRNGRGWHVGFSDGSVVMFPTNPRVYFAGNPYGAASDWNSRHKNWTYWDQVQNP